jgi:hypothetical protein
VKNKLSDLNDHLFAQLERLGDENLSPDDLKKEISRADAIVAVADKIVMNAATQVRAMQVIAEHAGAITIPKSFAIEFKEP